MSYTDKYKVDVPEGEKGDWKIERFFVGEKDGLWQIAELINSGRHVPEGNYTRLTRNGSVIMSDTPDEISDHYTAIRKAKGTVLIAGLGLGMYLNAVASKDEVTHVTVVEKSQDVLDLVAEHYNKKFPGKITFVKADIFEYKPAKNEKYDCAWFDIWDNLCTDNLEQMTILHRRFSRRASWKGSWGKEYLQYQKRRERNWW
jgi:spermidine synthase